MIQNPEIEEPSTAVSLYGDNNDAMDDFPILKAFQQYVDNEQAKARRRMVGVTFFFMFILLLFVGAAGFIIYSQSNSIKDMDSKIQQTIQDKDTKLSEKDIKIQELNDRLLSYASDAAKADIQMKMLEIEKQRALDAQKAMNEPSQAQLEKEKSLLEMEKNLKKEMDSIKAEKKELERLRSVEAHRRSLYPDYYEPAPSPAKPLPKPVVKPQPLPKPTIKKSPVVTPKKPAPAKPKVKVESVKPLVKVAEEVPLEKVDDELPLEDVSDTELLELIDFYTQHKDDEEEAAEDKENEKDNGENTVPAVDSEWSIPM